MNRADLFLFSIAGLLSCLIMRMPVGPALGAGALPVIILIVIAPMGKFLMGIKDHSPRR